ncbi:MAG: sigma-54-dependent Fis family transcriptional regulator [Planctomycetota bacterium]|nr:sigma-54-dependent Fis family transcriptional regulator [Planctomycetota bacterium]
MLSPADRDIFFQNLDLLRSAFIDFASRQYRTTDEPKPKSVAKQAFSWKSDLIIEGIIGSSPAISAILKIIASVAPSDLTVLLEGETGTGKELFARIIHLNSKREKFTAVNCGAFPPGVIESELFGHLKGSFTGATSDRKGKFEEADGGTIFLDEIGELEPLAQVKLLRVLETGELQRVGSDKYKQVDVRVIAATNRNLDVMVREGRFREDLYYRLNMCPIQLPPLRERRDEIGILLEYFLEAACAKQNKPVPKIDPELRHYLCAIYDYRGNIRELKNIAQFLACMVGEGSITIEHLPERYRTARDQGGNGTNGSNGNVEHRRAMLMETERVYWVSMLQKHRGDVRKICSETKLSRSRVYQLLDQCKLKPNAFR